MVALLLTVVPLVVGAVLTWLNPERFKRTERNLMRERLEAEKVFVERFQVGTAERLRLERHLRRGVERYVDEHVWPSGISLALLRVTRLATVLAAISVTASFALFTAHPPANGKMKLSELTDDVHPANPWQRIGETAAFVTLMFGALLLMLLVAMVVSSIRDNKKLAPSIDPPPPPDTSVTPPPADAQQSRA